MMSKPIQNKFEVMQNDINRLATNNSRLKKVSIDPPTKPCTNLQIPPKHLIAHYLTQTKDNNHINRPPPSTNHISTSCRYEMQGFQSEFQSVHIFYKAMPISYSCSCWLHAEPLSSHIMCLKKHIDYRGCSYIFFSYHCLSGTQDRKHERFAMFLSPP
eukprot:Pgem_evm2s19285